MNAFISFFKRQYVFCIACLCAAASCFFVPPSIHYVNYIDWNTLAMLFSLMAAVAGFEKCGLFMRTGSVLTTLVHTARGLAAVLVGLCFCTSMFITNDVALITFVPLALLLMQRQKAVPAWVTLYVVVLQTIAANTGSMLTPMGNPQNIFLFSKTNMGIALFLKIITPYSVLSAVLIALGLLAVPKIRLAYFTGGAARGMSVPKWHTFVYATLFALCLLAVGGIIPKLVLVPIVALTLLFIDRKVLASIDYWLLLTFCAFFVFSGNIATIPEISAFLKRVVGGNEFLASLIASQVISNVPATLLLYPFVNSTASLLLGVNVGGLGTLVASLASLISFKLFTKAGGNSGRYLAVFTALNLLFLAALSGLYAMKLF